MVENTNQTKKATRLGSDVTKIPNLKIDVN